MPSNRSLAPWASGPGLGQHSTRLLASHRAASDAKGCPSSPGLALFLASSSSRALLGALFYVFSEPFTSQTDPVKLGLPIPASIPLRTPRQQRVARRQGMKLVCHYQLSAGRMSLSIISKFSPASTKQKALHRGRAASTALFLLE